MSTVLFVLDWLNQCQVCLCTNIAYFHASYVEHGSKSTFRRYYYFNCTDTHRACVACSDTDKFVSCTSPLPRQLFFSKDSILKAKWTNKWGLCQFLSTEGQTSKVFTICHISNRSFEADFTKDKIAHITVTRKPFCQYEGSLSALKGCRTCPLLNGVLALTGT